MIRRLLRSVTSTNLRVFVIFMGLAMIAFAVAQWWCPMISAFVMGIAGGWVDYERTAE